MAVQVQIAPHTSHSDGFGRTRSLTLITDVAAFTHSLPVCSYAELIADWPVVVLGVCTVLIVVCALVGILVPDLPDFSDPLLVSTAQVDQAEAATACAD